MSSYHSSFTYNGSNSLKKNLIIAAFDPDDGLVESFLSMDSIQENYFDGTKKYDYGARYNSTASIKITVVKANGKEFTVSEIRSYFKWLTGSRVNSWLDLYVNDNIAYSFLGKVTDIQQYKLDARCIGLTITFTSLNPWAYSPQQSFSCNYGKELSITENGVLYSESEDNSMLGITDDGILYNDTADENSVFYITDDGVLYIDDTITMQINNQTDDLYTYIYLETEYKNIDGEKISIENVTLDEKTEIKNMKKNETVTLSAEQFIFSDNKKRIFGDDFNFIWPRLAPGTNEIMVNGFGNKGSVRFTYRYPMKVGDCAMDISTYGGGISCGDCYGDAIWNTVRWQDITGTPTTIGGYGITDAYTKTDVNNKFNAITDVNIDEQELRDALVEVFDE